MSELAVCIAPHPASFSRKWYNLTKDVGKSIEKETGVVEFRTMLIR